MWYQYDTVTSSEKVFVFYVKNIMNLYTGTGTVLKVIIVCARYLYQYLLGMKKWGGVGTKKNFRSD